MDLTKPIEPEIWDEAFRRALTATENERAKVVELGSPLKNLAAGATATASFTAPDTTAANAVDGWTSSGPTVAPGAYVLTPSFAAYNPIWGTKGSPNAQGPHGSQSADVKDAEVVDAEYAETK